MRRLFSLFALPLFASQLVACAHVVGFDRQAGTVSIQAGKWGSARDAQEAANRYCGHRATLLGMQQTEVGSYTTSQAQGFGNAYGAHAYGSSTTKAINRDVYTYSCR